MVGYQITEGTGDESEIVQFSLELLFAFLPPLQMLSVSVHWSCAGWKIPETMGLLVTVKYLAAYHAAEQSRVAI